MSRETMKIKTPSWMKILSITDNTCLLELSNKANITFSNCYDNFKELEKKGLLTSKKIGRKRIVMLTEKGKELLPHVVAIKNFIEKNG